MNGNYGKFRRLLEELFQLDHADLDFGIYRIMNQKRDDIMRFLDNDLLPQVQEAFKEYQGSDRSSTEAELKEAIQQADSLGVDPESTGKVKELREKLSQAVDVTKLENEVFSDLYDFFRRYYHEGDFLSLRRYKEGVYAIPYEGEEVKLHWANHDQYYVKTSEYFRDYTFKLPSGKRAHFKLVEADTEKDNQKAETGKERRFILCYDDPMMEADGDLYIRFEYRPDSNKNKQNTLNSAAFAAIMNTPGFGEWKTELAQPMPTEGNPNRTLLEKRLSDYTARNTFDYFIHKDLSGFLRRELDFYIKNEIMHLDDIENESAPRVEQYLSKIKAIRKIAHKIIQFLAQIEDFQKKLWLKKKFVVETNYCVTLDRVLEELYPEIAANEAQREEWERLFAINEIKGDQVEAVEYPKSLTVEFLKANPQLILDTVHFSAEFKLRLVGAIEDIDEQCDGVLVHSENFQALNLMIERYRSQVKCIYIDPPYNTGSDEFIYKDSYQHSSWLAMVEGRLQIAREWMREDGAIFVSIDDGEQAKLRGTMEVVFGSENFVNNIIWQKKFSPQNDARWLSDNHDFLICFAKLKEVWRPRLLPRTEAQDKRYQNPDSDPRGPWMSSDLSVKTYSSEYDYPITTPSGRTVHPPKTRCWFTPKGNVGKLIAENRIWFGSDGNGVPRLKRFLSETKQGITPLTIWTYKEVGHNQEGKQELKATLLEGDLVFGTPKPVRLLSRLVTIGAGQSDTILDYFAGSGTTAHAVINLNREDNGSRKYILVEMGDYFETVLLPRIKKAIYSKDWKNGKPISREGVSHMFKYIRLESYENTLNNLELKRTKEQESLLAESDSFRESYMLSYMLDTESDGSPSLLNVNSFVDPFDYRLKIATDSAGETRPVTVDLVETFNYLLGLTVHHIDHIRGFRVVQGTSPEGGKVLIIWRNLKEKSNEDLEEFFRRQEYNPKDMEFDLIYVNGDNNLENIRRPDETWKVRLIEEDFQRLMFDVEDI